MNITHGTWSVQGHTLVRRSINIPMLVTALGLALIALGLRHHLVFAAAVLICAIFGLVTAFRNATERIVIHPSASAEWIDQACARLNAQEASGVSEVEIRQEIARIWLYEGSGEIEQTSVAPELSTDIVRGDIERTLVMLTRAEFSGPTMDMLTRLRRDASMLTDSERNDLDTACAEIEASASRYDQARCDGRGDLAQLNHDLEVTVRGNGETIRRIDESITQRRMDESAIQRITTQHKHADAEAPELKI